MSDESGLPDQTPEERRDIARRYRAQRTAELRRLAAAAMDEEPQAVGEFTASRFEQLAAVPFIGPFLALGMKLKERMSGVPSHTLIALGPSSFNVIQLPGVTTLMIPGEGTGPEPGPVAGESRASNGDRVISVPRDLVRVQQITAAGAKHKISFDLGADEDPLELYTSSLATNPWSRELLNALGAEGVPDGIDPTAEDPLSSGEW